MQARAIKHMSSAEEEQAGARHQTAPFHKPERTQLYVDVCFNALFCNASAPTGQ